MILTLDAQGMCRASELRPATKGKSELVAFHVGDATFFVLRRTLREALALPRSRKPVEAWIGELWGEPCLCLRWATGGMRLRYATVAGQSRRFVNPASAARWEKDRLAEIARLEREATPVYVQRAQEKCA